MSIQNDLQQFVNACIEEEKAIEKVLKTNTLDGMRAAIKIWEKHFSDKYTHGVSVIKDLARVNVLRQLKGKPFLVDTSGKEIERIAYYDRHEIYFVGNNGYYFGGKTIPLTESKAEIKQLLSNCELPIDAIKAIRKHLGLQ